MNVYKLLAVGLGGFLGSIARYITVRLVDEKYNSVFPYGTLTVNIVGCFLIGFIYSIAARNFSLTENWRLFLGAGFCGGFTTFSAFAWENLNLIQQKHFAETAIYILASLVVGVVSVLVGVWIGRSI